jgi:hypothetical protein
MCPTLADAADPTVLQEYTLVEHFGVHHPEQMIDFDLPKKMAAGTVHMVGPEGQPVISQLIQDGTKIAVLAELKPNEKRTWKLMSGPSPKTFPAQVNVTDTTLGKLAVLAISNKLTGVKVPARFANTLVTSEEYRPFWNTLGAKDYSLAFAPAPIQDLLWRDGTWASAGVNTLFKAGIEFRQVTKFTKYESKVIERGPLRAVVDLIYSLEAADWKMQDKLIDKGGAKTYRCRVTVEAGRPSVLVEEESNTNTAWSMNLWKGLKPNMIRKRGHSASEVKYGQNEDGSLYTDGLGKDGFQPFTIDHLRRPSHQTNDDGFMAVSPWNPWCYNGGWYWQMYNKDGADKSNLLGLYAARCGSAVGACYNGPAIWYSPPVPPTNPKAKPGDPLCGIGSQSSRYAVDARIFPKSRVIWGLYVGTKGELKPPTEVQPINVEMNIRGGFGLNKLYRYHVDFPDPKDGYGGLFMPKDAVEDIKKRIRDDKEGPQGKGYYGYLYQAEPYGRELFDLWAEPGREKFDKAVEATIKKGQELARTLTLGCGIMDFHWHYWHGGATMQREIVRLDQFLGDSRCTEEQRKKLKAAAVLFGSVVWDNDFVPIDNHEGFNMGTANMPIQMAMCRNMYSQFLATHPLFVERSKKVAMESSGSLNWVFNEHGIVSQSPHYTGASVWPTLNLLNMVRQRSGIDPYAKNERVEKFTDFYLNLLTPPDSRLAGSTFEGGRLPVLFGDGGMDPSAIYGLAGTALRDASPRQSARLMGAWQASRKPHGAFYGSSVLMIDDRLKAEDPKLGDYDAKNYYSVLRHGWGSPNESALWLITGDRYADHRHVDHGSVVLHALGKPLIEHWSSMYQPHVPGSFSQNGCTLDLELPHSWNADAVDSRGTSSTWIKSEPLAYQSFPESGFSRARFTAEYKPSSSGSSVPNKPRKVQWTRSVLALRAEPAKPVYILRDEFDSPDVYKLLTLNLHASGPVESEGKKVEINEARLCPRADKPTEMGHMPFVGPTMKLEPNGHRFGFRNPAGVNVEMFIVGDGAEATLGNWAVGVQTSSFGEQHRTQRMHTLRVRTSSELISVFVPWKGDPAPPNVKLNGTRDEFTVTCGKVTYIIARDRYTVHHGENKTTRKFD